MGVVKQPGKKILIVIIFDLVKMVINLKIVKVVLKKNKKMNNAFIIIF